MKVPNLNDKPTYRIDAPVICSACGKPFHTGQVWTEEGLIINSFCKDCHNGWLLEHHAQGT